MGLTRRMWPDCSCSQSSTFYPSFVLASLTINIVNSFSNIDSEILINPYIIIVCKEGSKVSFQEFSQNVESWNNTVKEVFIRKNSNLIFSSLQERIPKGIKTSSFNCHIDENAELNLKV